MNLGRGLVKTGGMGCTGIKQKSAVQWSGVGIESMSIDDVDIFASIVLENLMF